MTSQLEMTIRIIHKCYLYETIPDPIERPKLSVELEVPQYGHNLATNFGPL